MNVAIEEIINVFNEMNYKEDYFYYKNDQIQNNKLLVFGDSYSTAFLLKPIAESFSEVFYCRHPDGNVMRTVIDIFKPDYVLYEMVDRVYFGNKLKFEYLKSFESTRE
jgi:hypothetical protein